MSQLFAWVIFAAGQERDDFLTGLNVQTSVSGSWVKAHRGAGDDDGAAAWIKGVPLCAEAPSGHHAFSHQAPPPPRQPRFTRCHTGPLVLHHQQPPPVAGLRGRVRGGPQRH